MSHDSHSKTDPTYFEGRLANGEPLASVLDGFDPAETDAGGECLMHFAAKLNLGHLCRGLGKARPELALAKDLFGLTPLMLAANDGKNEALASLMPISEIDARSNRGSTALLLAAKKGHAEIAKLLIQNGADPTAKDLHGSTLLHMAARAKLDKDLIEWAMELCDPSLTDANGMTALNVLEKNPDPNAKSFKAALERGILDQAAGAPSTHKANFSL